MNNTMGTNKIAFLSIYSSGKDQQPFIQNNAHIDLQYSTGEKIKCRQQVTGEENVDSDQNEEPMMKDQLNLKGA